MTSSELAYDSGCRRRARSAPAASRLAAIFLLLLSLAWTAPGFAHGNTPIFMLHSYSQEYPWTKRQHEGYLRKLTALVPGEISAQVEYLDTKRVPYTTEYADMFAGYLAKKYAGFQPELIYVSDDNALLFALAHLTRIFPKVPIFFSGINDRAMKQRIDPRQVTGVFEEKEIAPNLYLMRHLAPEVRDILVVGDESETYKAIRTELLVELARQPDIRTQFVSSGRIEQLVAALQARKQRFVFLTTLGAMRDAAGNTLTLPEILAAIVKAGRFIIISMEDVYLYPGVLGGYVTSGDKQGASAAELSARYLAGSAVAAIKPIESSPNEYIIDGGELDRLGLTLPRELAGRTTIINPVPTFYERYSKIIGPLLYTIALLFAATLLGFIYALWRKNRQIDRASRDLGKQTVVISEVKESLVRAQRIAGVGSWEWTPASDTITWSEGLNFILARDIAMPAPASDALPQFYTPESWERLQAAAVNTLKTGMPYEAELEMLRSDGTTIWTATRGEAVRGADGAVVKLRGTVHDIDARKRADLALRESEERYRSLINWSPEAIIVHRDGKILYVNPAAIRIFGAKSAQDLIGTPIVDRIHPDARELALERVKRIFGEGVSTPPVEMKYLRLDGTIINVEAQGVSVVYDGQPAIHTSIRDINERKQADAVRASLEAQLRESQKMEALGTLAGGVAHDFNNALAMIIGNVELARQDVGAAHPALESLEEIGKAARRARDLVQQILAFGRRQKLERKATALALVVVESARLLRATLPGEVTLTVDCKADTPAVLADATQVKQILLNLCGNALQAIQDQGRPGVIEVSLNACVCSQGEARGDLRPGRYACLTVSDNGPGMDEATRSRIFDPFFTTKPVGKGTGLGLAVVYGIVRAHEASIEVESTPGEGSAFRIYFPATDLPLEAVAAPVADAVPIQARGQHILYVDDEEAIIFLMTRLLERQGYRVSGYTDPREALAAVRADPAQFDLAVTDFNMPVMSGLEVAQALKEIRPALPVVMASGYITEELRAKAPAAGIRELIYKPNTVDDLCAAVARFANAQNGKPAAT
jgi:PAS domain S-box-containing protein